MARVAAPASPLLADPVVDFPTDGWRAIEFIESFCRYTKGPQARELVRLRTWQKRLILTLYRRRPDGKRQYRRGLWGLARKNGKTMLGACLALYELVMGEYGGEVYSVAGDRDQARICFDEAMKMTRLDAELSAICVIRDAQATILCASNGSTYRALAADSATAEGYNPSFVVFDEVHVQRDARLWEVMVNGSGTRESAVILGITTAGYDLNTLCGRLYKMGKKGAPESFMFEWHEPADANCDWLDEKVWREANPGLGDYQNIDDFRAAADEAKERGAENAFRRYRLNQWTGSIEAWLPYGAWDRLSSDERIETEEPIVLGFDGSFSGDSTAVVACTIDRETPYIQVMAAWERPDGDAGTGWRVDIAAVEKQLVELAKEYTVREIACDPYRWQRSIQALLDQGLPMTEYLTTSPARMVRATTIFADAVRDGTLGHAPDEDLARHIQNAKIKTDFKGPRLTKESNTSAKHIDLAVAAVIALDRATSQEPEDMFEGNIW